MIDFTLEKKPKNVKIIEGFPGYGLVANIAIEFLIDHLKAEMIGEFTYNEIPPMVAVHKGELVRPMSIWYVPKHKIVLLHTTQDVKGLEWEMADRIIDLAEALKANEIITLEGVASNEDNIYTYNNKKLEHLGAKQLKESIIGGVSAALLLKNKKITPVFAGAHSELPDGQAAAKIIKILDQYLGLNVDYKPLLKKAEEFEKKLKGIVQKTKKAQEEIDKKKMSYLG